MGLITLDDVTKEYEIGDACFLALRGVSLDIKKGEFVTIMGPSGSGKSTMLHILGCLDSPTSGKYYLNGKLVSELSDNELSRVRNQEIGFVFQMFNLLPRISVFDNVMMPFLYSSVSRKERIRRVDEALNLVGLQSKHDNKSNQLSGGQIQRVAIARSLVMDPSIILADEPTGNLDSKTSDEVMDIFTQINKSGKTIVVITHEQDIAEYGSRMLYIRDGLIEEVNKKSK